MATSSGDRERMARIGALKAATHERERAAHLALPLSARLAKSWALFERFRGERVCERNDDALAFYARARELKLYRG